LLKEEGGTTTACSFKRNIRLHWSAYRSMSTTICWTFIPGNWWY